MEKNRKMNFLFRIPPFLFPNSVRTQYDEKERDFQSEMAQNGENALSSVLTLTHPLRCTQVLFHVGGEDSETRIVESGEEVKRGD